MSARAVSFEPLADTFGVGLKPFGRRKRRDRIRELLQPVGIDPLDGCRPQEGVDREPAEPFRAAVGRQDVIRSGGVIAGSDRRVWP